MNHNYIDIDKNSWKLLWELNTQNNEHLILNFLLTSEEELVIWDKNRDVHISINFAVCACVFDQKKQCFSTYTLFSLKQLCAALNIEKRSVDRDLDVYRNLLSKLVQAKELLKEYVAR